MKKYLAGGRGILIFTVTLVKMMSLIINDPQDNFKNQQRRIVFYNSQTFKKAEKSRVESFKPTEHETISPGRTYCPIFDAIRPSHLCQVEHGDYLPGLDDGEGPRE